MSRFYGKLKDVQQKRDKSPDASAQKAEAQVPVVEQPVERMAKPEIQINQFPGVDEVKKNTGLKKTILIAAILCVCAFFLGVIANGVTSAKKDDILKLEEALKAQTEQMQSLKTSMSGVESTGVDQIKQINKRIANMASTTDAKIEQMEDKINTQLNETKSVVGNMRMTVDGLKLQLDRLKQKVSDLTLQSSEPITVK